MKQPILNPFRPGAGHPPPYLAGREEEKREFLHLLDQEPLLTNLVLTGLRGVGKTVLLETLKPLAIQKNWLWAGTDLSESAVVSEDSIAVRILADLSPLTANTLVSESETRGAGFTAPAEKQQTYLDFSFLKWVYDNTPGLTSDKLKTVLELVWTSLSLNNSGIRGVVLAYDEAQNLSDQGDRRQYPLSLLLDVFQSIQKKGFPFLLVLTGLPTLFPKLTGVRTFSERMFHVVTLGRLNEKECRDAILKPMAVPSQRPLVLKTAKPIALHSCPVRFTTAAVAEIVKYSGGYPYFIQFLCREMFDSYLQQKDGGEINPVVTVEQTIRKLDSDFFAGRWNRVTDRQRELLSVVSQLPNCDDEFTVQEVVEQSHKGSKKPFSPSHANQILAKLADNGLVYKNRHGRYLFAVPLLGGFIRRQEAPEGV